MRRLVALVLLITLAVVAEPSGATRSNTTLKVSGTSTRILKRKAVPSVPISRVIFGPLRHKKHHHKKNPTTTTTVPTTTTVVLTDATSTDTPDWACIRYKESGDNYASGGDEPYGGAYQISVQTWQYMGFQGVPNEAPDWMQDEAALDIYAWDLKYTGDPWYAWETAPLCGL
jgi:hypothetical protein